MWLARIEKVNKLSRKDLEKSDMPGRQEKVTATLELSTSRPHTTVQIIRQETLSLVLIRIRTMEAIVLRTLTGWFATGLDPGTAKQELQKFSVINWAMTAQLMSGNLFRTILLLHHQLPVILTTHHIPLPPSAVPERASTLIWKVFQTTSLNMVRSRQNHLQL